MKEATFRLMTEGTTGPQTTFEVNEDATRTELETLARCWAEGQAGHPWDVVTVSSDEDSFEVEI